MSDEIRQVALDALPSVEIIQLKPGDCLVLQSDGHISSDEAARVREMIAGVFPGCRVLVLSRYQVSVLRPSADVLATPVVDRVNG